MSGSGLHSIEYDDRPSVLLIADSDSGLRRLGDAARQLGCRISGSALLSQGLDRLEQQVSVHAVLMAVEEDHPQLDPLLGSIGDNARTGRFGSVVSGPAGLIDQIYSKTAHGDVVQLCGLDQAELLAAIATVTSRRPPKLHDSGRGTAKLQQLSEEVGRIANILARLSEDEALAETTSPPEEGGAEELTAASVRAMIRARRLRDQYFPSDLFADPAWDMLLDLMAARLDRQRVAVSSLCIAAAVPATTALRWIKTLTDYGLFVRVADPHDGRRVFIELSDRAATQLGSYLRAVQRLAPFAI